MKDLLLVLIGGICSTFGGFFATWYRAKKAGEIKFRETIGERKVSVFGMGLELIRQFQSVLIQNTKEDALEFLYEHGSWFVDNMIVLPHVFVENWQSIKLALHEIVQIEEALNKMPAGEKNQEMVENVIKKISSCRSLAGAAEKSILSELN
jgi:hypothetical protein